MCVLRVCILCFLVLATTELLMLLPWGGGVNRNACVRVSCVHEVLLGTLEHCAASSKHVLSQMSEPNINFGLRNHCGSSKFIFKMCH